MDSNNFYGNAGVGEREGRILSGMVCILVGKVSNAILCDE